MKRLGVNIDHVATLRNARGGIHPDPFKAAKQAIIYGADSITIHLREDRRHIKDSDLKNIIKTKIPLNLDVMPSSFLDFECEGELWEYTKEQMDALIGGMEDNLPEGMTDNLTDMMDDVLDGDLPDGFPSLNFP